METLQINVATDFNRFPYGRYRDQGEYSGQRFREERLLPALEKGQPVIVDLDGTSGLSPSFLDESFGGLIRAGLPLKRLEELLTVKSDDDPSYAEEAWIYIREAAAVRG